MNNNLSDLADNNNNNHSESDQGNKYLKRVSDIINSVKNSSILMKPSNVREPMANPSSESDSEYSYLANKDVSELESRYNVVVNEYITLARTIYESPSSDNAQNLIDLKEKNAELLEISNLLNTKINQTQDNINALTEYKNRKINDLDEKMNDYADLISNYDKKTTKTDTLDAIMEDSKILKKQINLKYILYTISALVLLGITFKIVSKK